MARTFRSSALSYNEMLEKQEFKYINKDMVGSEVLITKTVKGETVAYCGVVTSHSRNAGGKLTVDVNKYFCEGSHRPKFKNREVSLTERSILSIFVLYGKDDSLNDFKKRRANARHAKSLLRSRREESTDAFKILGVNRDLDLAGLRTITRKICIIWHPDKSKFSNLKAEEFASKSKLMMDALSEVTNYIKAVNR